MCSSCCFVISLFGDLHVSAYHNDTGAKTTGDNEAPPSRGDNVRQRRATAAGRQRETTGDNRRQRETTETTGDNGARPPRGRTQRSNLLPHEDPLQPKLFGEFACVLLCFLRSLLVNSSSSSNRNSTVVIVVIVVFVILVVA